MANIELKNEISKAINQFSTGTLVDNGIKLFRTLGYETDRQSHLDNCDYQTFAENYVQDRFNFSNEKALTKDWSFVDIMFQLSKEEVLKRTSLFDTKKVDNTIIEAYLFICIELKNEHYSRTDLSQITREINKLFPMPVMVLFKYGNIITLSVINRRIHKREPSKDVLEKVTLIKDISIESPHRAHIEIFHDLAFDVLNNKFNFTNFVELHNAWQKVLDTKELNKKFFSELSAWYFWAAKHFEFPSDTEKNREIRNATSVIRLITRLMFVWFLKEKGLVPQELFDKRNLLKILKIMDDSKSTFYKAILQNLFFATLNTEMGKRKFRSKSSNNRDGNYFIHNVFRYEDYFNSPNETLKAFFENIPFLNGGLFECLDKEIEEHGKLKQIRIDGFSDREDNPISLPNEYFFCEKEKDIDLNDVYDTKNKKYKFRGIIDILNSYKFTIAENTPIEEEIALDPELLGKVFENLLANYNPETQTTARKQTGSFYTPREIVNYMVDESLVAYLNQKLDETDDSENKLRNLVSYCDELHSFKSKEVETLINAIDNIKILDPACGSGAFPMGILHKLVHILHKLDPKNKLWKQRQIEKASHIDDAKVRDAAIDAIEEAFENNELDYGRKLYLIENCIYGVDIQPIAAQISKLRFFISLIVEQKANSKHDNLGIRPLPNLETKFVAANTLIGLDKEKDQKSIFENPEIEKIKEELRKVRHSYFEARTPKTKEKYRNLDRELREKLALILEKEHYLDNRNAKRVSSWNPYDQNLTADFFEPEWMFGLKDGFEIVIGNPPYVQLQSNSGELAKQYQHCQFKTFERTGDIYSLFYEKGWQVLKPQGHLCFITSNKWMRAGYGESTRKFFAENTNPKTLIDFAGQKIFESATVDTNILLYEKAKNQGQTQACTVKENCTDNISVYIKQYVTRTNFENSESWVILSPIEQRIKEKIEKIGTPLKQWDINIYRGILTGFNDAFIISGEKKDQLIKEDPKSAEIIRPILRGRDIKRYGYEFANLWLINTHNGIKEKGIKPININDYPAIKQHLDIYWKQIEKRQDQGVTPYNLRNCAYMEDFYKQKIVWNRIASEKVFGIVEEGVFISDSMHFIIGNHLKYICALLNSKLLQCLLNIIVGEAAGGNAGNSDNIKNLPIFKPTIETEQIIEKLLETQQYSDIDKIVFEIYNLTKEEINFIESQ